MAPNPTTTGSLPQLPASYVAELSSDLGALLIGTFLSLTLYGLSVHQAYLFFNLYQDERRRTLKTVISIILLLETVHGALCIHATYDFLIVEKPFARTYQGDRWSFNVLSTFAAVIFCITQSLFARRVALLWSKYGIMVAIGAGVLTVGQLGTAIAATVLLYIPRTEEIVHPVLWLSCAHYTLVFLASMLMAAALFYCLRRAHSEFDETNHILRILLKYTVNTGVLVGVSSLISLIFVLIWPDTRRCAAVDMVATNLYFVSLLAELNSRQELTATSPTRTLQLPASFRPISPKLRRAEMRAKRRESRGLQHMSVRGSAAPDRLRRPSRTGVLTAVVSPQTPWSSQSSAAINIRVTTEVIRDHDLKNVL